MNRQTILKSIHRQLRDDLAESGEVRPLGEIVARVAREIRVDAKASAAPDRTQVIAIEKVSAFVDGHLESADEYAICDAVMVDNSVLAELVSAVRGTQTAVERLPSLSPALSDKLMAMRITSVESTDVIDDSVNTSGDATIVMVQPTSNSTHHRIADRRKRLRIAAGLLAIAATIIAAIAIMDRTGDESNQFDPNHSIVERGGDPQSVPLPDEVQDIDPVPPETAQPNGPMQDIVETETPNQEADRDAEPVIPELMPAVPIRQSPAEAVARDTPDEVVVPVAPESDPTPDPSMLNDRPRLARFRWTEVSGLLAVRNDSSEQTGPRRAPTWRRLQEGAPLQSDSSPSSPPLASDESFVIRTLPYSRASGEFSDSGRMVVAGDTGLLINRGVTNTASVDVMYGSVAMIDFDDGTNIQLQQGGTTVATLRWTGKATAVVVRQNDGLHIQVDGGQIEINDQAVKEKSVRVAKDRYVETIRAQRRLPRWVARPDETTAAERVILAQIADSNDVAGSLNQKIAALAASQRLSRDETMALAKLANWQAAMAGANLYRLVGNRVPASRFAALQRLVQLPESDPRYSRTWAAIERAVNDPQRYAQIRSWFGLVKNGQRPNRAQMEQLVTGLSTRELAGRAVSDFILRQYVGNAPPFDPTWSGQTLQRAVNIYRQRAGLPADRARTNAAAGNRN